jgi:hypothetical protein
LRTKGRVLAVVASAISTVSAFGAGGAASDKYASCIAAVTEEWSTVYDGTPGAGARAAAGFSGRTTTFNLFPNPQVINSKETANAVAGGWEQVSNWKCTPENIMEMGHGFMFECNWAGSVSNINGYTMEDGSNSSTVHLVDCDKNTESVNADFTGVLAAFGAV